MSFLNEIIASIWSELYPKVKADVDRAHEAAKKEGEIILQEVADKVKVAYPPPQSDTLEDILDAAAAQHKRETGETLAWDTSIVDLLKLTKQPSDLAARRRLAAEFGKTNFTEAAADNEWLHEKWMEWLSHNYS